MRKTFTFKPLDSGMEGTEITILLNDIDSIMVDTRYLQKDGRVHLKGGKSFGMTALDIINLKRVLDG